MQVRVETHERICRSVSRHMIAARLLESGEQRYTKSEQQQHVQKDRMRTLTIL